MTEINRGDFDEERAIQIEEAATELLIAVWRAIQDGRIPDRGQIDDATLRLRDSLNPDIIENPDWLPDALVSELGYVATSFQHNDKDKAAIKEDETLVDESDTSSETILVFGQDRQAAIRRTTKLIASNRSETRRQRQRRNSRRRWV